MGHSAKLINYSYSVGGWSALETAFSSSIAVRNSSKTAYLTNHQGLSTPTYTGQLFSALALGVGAGVSPIQFWNGSPASAKMTILENGNVGIGTSAPISTLSVATTSNTTDLGSTGLTIGGLTTLTTGNVLMLNFTPIGTDSNRARAGIGCVVGADWGKGNLTFYTRNSSDATAMTTADERMRITQDGDVIIGSTTDQGNWKAQVTGNMFIRGSDSLSATIGLYMNSSTGIPLFTVSNTGIATFGQLGTGTVSATAGVLSAVSDSRLKDEDGFITDALTKVLSLQPRYFKWKTDNSAGLPSCVRQLGFFAQEVQSALGEEVVNTPPEGGNYGIHDRGIIAMLVKALQEQQVIIDSLLRSAESLDNRLKVFETR